MSTFFAYNNILVGNGNRVLGIPDDPHNPLHLRPFTVRFKFGNLDYDPMVDYGGDYAPTHGYPTWQEWWGRNFHTWDWPYVYRKDVISWTRVSENPNIWDYTCLSDDWNHLLGGQYFSYLNPNNTSYPEYITPCGTYEILGANTTGVTDMNSLFENGAYTYLPLFDTSAVTTIDDAFRQTQITTIPEYDFTNVISAVSPFYNTSTLRTLPKLNMPNCTVFSPCIYCTNLQYIPEIVLPSTITSCEGAFRECYNVQYGILDAYNYLSSLTITGYPEYQRTGYRATFYLCGRDSATGSAELAQVPADWKGNPNS
jgi:hypothetical protein